VGNYVTSQITHVVVVVIVVIHALIAWDNVQIVLDVQDFKKKANAR